MLATFLTPSCVHYLIPIPLMYFALLTTCCFFSIELVGPGEKFFGKPPHFHLTPGGISNGIDAIHNGAHEPDYVCMSYE